MQTGGNGFILGIMEIFNGNYNINEATGWLGLHKLTLDSKLDFKSLKAYFDLLKYSLIKK